MDYLDDAMRNLEERELRKDGEGGGQEAAGEEAGRVRIGRVSRFFDKINVAAVELTGSLRVGDTIEIDDGETVMRQKVASMQIDRREVEEASSGDDVGIKIGGRVRAGSEVYRIR